MVFPIGAIYESAQRAQEQDSIQKLEQGVDLTLYRQACIDYYGQFDITFPDNLDPCMYELYLTNLGTDQYWQITNDGPYPLDYMDLDAYYWLVDISYKSYPELPKNDPVDAFVIADQLRFGRIGKEVYMDDYRYKALQTLTRARFFAVQNLMWEKERFANYLFLKCSGIA